MTIKYKKLRFINAELLKIRWKAPKRLLLRGKQSILDMTYINIHMKLIIDTYES